MNEVKIWRCKHGHALGQVRKNGRGVSQLYLYRHAVESGAAPAEVDVMAVVQGSVVDIRCDVPGCGEMRTWVPGEAEMERLLARYANRKVADGTQGI